MKTESGDPNVITHEVRGANGQVADLMQVKKYDGTVISKLDKDGYATHPFDPDTATYIIWRSGSTYYAKVGATGAVAFSGANAATVIQAAIDAIDAIPGGKIHFKDATYVLTATLTFTQPRIHLEGEGLRTILNYTPNDGTHALDFSAVDSTGIARELPTIENMTLIGPEVRSVTAGAGIYSHSPTEYVGMKLRNLHITRFGQGINLMHALISDIQACEFNECDIGAHIESCHGSTIRGCSCEWNNTGYFLQGQTVLNIDGGTIEGNYKHGIDVSGNNLECTVKSIYFEANGLSDVDNYHDVYLHEVAGFRPQRFLMENCYHSGAGSETDIMVEACAGISFINSQFMRADNVNINMTGSSEGALILGGKITTVTGLVRGGNSEKTLWIDQYGNRKGDGEYLANNFRLFFRTLAGGATNWLTVNADNKMYLVNASNLMLFQCPGGHATLFTGAAGANRLSVADGLITAYGILDATTSGVRNRCVSQAAQPAQSYDGTTLIWRDTDDLKTYLIGRIGNVDYKVEMGRPEVNLLSADFAIDAVAVVEVTTAHGLAVTPAAKDASVTLIESTAVDDWACGFVKIVSVDATNVVCKVNVTTASGTAGAKAKLGIKVAKK